jgi:hypothetical protein
MESGSGFGRDPDPADLPALGAPDRSHLALGAAGELFVAGTFALLGYQVYRPLADDRGVDLVVDVGRGRHVMVQVKSIRAKSGYVFMRKETFALEQWVALSLAVFESPADTTPTLFLFPSLAWAEPKAPFTSYDYEGKKSKPEYGLNLRKAWRTELARWQATPGHVAAVLDAARD